MADEFTTSDAGKLARSMGLEVKEHFAMPTESISVVFPKAEMSLSHPPGASRSYLESCIWLGPTYSESDDSWADGYSTDRHYDEAELKAALELAKTMYS